MKQRLTVSVIFFTVALILSVASQIVVSNKIDKCDLLLKQVYVAVCEKRMPEKEYKQLKNEWNKNSFLFHITISKNAVSELEKSIESMELIISENDLEHLKYKCIECLTSIKEIQESTKINLKNSL